MVKHLIKHITIFNDDIKRVDGKNRQYYGILLMPCQFCKIDTTHKILAFDGIVCTCCGVTKRTL